MRSILRYSGRIILVLLVVLLALRLGRMALQESFYGPTPFAADKAVVVPSGSTATVAASLHQDGIIATPIIFRAAVWLTRQDGPLHTGEFLFPAHSSLASILHILRHGAPVEHQVTIPEGLTPSEIAAVLNRAPAATGSVFPPAQTILPQTYDYTLGTSRAAILQRATDAMRVALADAWAQRAPNLPLTNPQDALTLASIVQQETPLPAEMPEIAAVYENRLRLGMKLQADPTVIYAASAGATSGGAAISRTDLANPSPYNTYVHTGLPPGPIAAPGLTAIEAVLHPAAMTALYFVATGTGGHVFSDDWSAHLKNVAKYRAYENRPR